MRPNAPIRSAEFVNELCAFGRSSAPVVAVHAVSAPEVTGSCSTLGFPVTLTPPSGVQVFVNYYASGIGDVCVVALLALVLLVRPQGLAGLTGGAPA